jgi:hypothetical protein
MNHSYRLLIPTLLLITILIGSVSAGIICPIPPPPYIPEFPEEDIIEVSAAISPFANMTAIATTLSVIPVAESLIPIVDGSFLHLTVTFASPTPPADKGILILVTMLQGNPPKEEVLYCQAYADPSSTIYTLDPIPITVDGILSIAVYAALGEIGTDRAPNDGFYQIQSADTNIIYIFQDIDPAPVGGISTPTNKLAILTPYLALAGLIITVSTVFVIKRRKD